MALQKFLLTAALVLVVGRPVAAVEDEDGAVPAAQSSTQSGTDQTDSEDAAALPPSLVGSVPDGELTVNADGQFVPTYGAVRLFEYFWTAEGEWPEARILARIDLELRKRLEGEALTQARAFLMLYQNYREQAEALGNTQPAGPNTPRKDNGYPTAARSRETLAALHALRADVFGQATARSLFANEEAVARFSIARRELDALPNLDPTERTRRIRELEATLPQEERDARARLDAPAQLRREERRLIEAGASEAEVQALREQRVGAEAAARLAELDRKRAQWDRRLLEYVVALRAIEGDPALGEDQRREARRRLRSERFEGHEVARIDVLQRAGLLPDPPRDPEPASDPVSEPTPAETPPGG